MIAVPNDNRPSTSRYSVIPTDDEPEKCMQETLRDYIPAVIDKVVSCTNGGRAPNLRHNNAGGRSFVAPLRRFVTAMPAGHKEKGSFDVEARPSTVDIHLSLWGA